MRLGFVTCVQLGLSCMEAIFEVGGHITLAITLLDHKAPNKSGRVFIDRFCEKHDVSLYKCDHINDPDVIEKIRAAELDWLFIIGWSQIASPDVLSAPKLGALGAHPTLLPEGRGRAAVPWAILKRLPRTGVTLFKLNEGVDTGEILDQVEIPLLPDVIATDLYASVSDAHVELIRRVVPKLMENKIALRPQDDALATTWPGRKPEDGQIDLNGSVHDAECLVRALARPYPGAYLHRNGEKLIIWKARVVNQPCSDCIKFKDGFLQILDCQSP